MPKSNFSRVLEQLRSVRLVNLPEGTNYGDIAAILRGGLVYEFYITHGAATATITFVEAASAEAYFGHVRSNGLFLKNKRVSTSSKTFHPLSQFHQLKHLRLVFAGPTATRLYPVITATESPMAPLAISSSVNAAPAIQRPLSAMISSTSTISKL